MAATLVRDLTLASPVVRTVDGVGLSTNSSDIKLGALRYNAPQNLTEEEKRQARENLGAGTGDTGSFRGNFSTWNDIPTSPAEFDGGTIANGDFVSVDDASGYHTELETEVLSIQRVEKNEKDADGNYIISAIIRPYLEDGKYYIVQHLYVGKVVSADIVTGDGTKIASKGDFLTSEQVKAIGESTLTELPVYTTRTGRWLLRYSSPNGTYSKDNFSWWYQLNNDTEIYIQMNGLEEVVAGILGDLGEEVKRAKASETDIQASVSELANKIKEIRELPDFSNVKKIPKTTISLDILRDKFNEMLEILKNA